MNTSKASAAAAILLVFLAGGVIGGLGGSYFQREQVSRLINEAGARSPSGLPPHIMARISRELDLTPEQQAGADRIFAKYGQEMRALKTRFRPEFERIMNQGFDALNAILTPDQQPRLARLKKRLTRRRPLHENRKHRNPDHEYPPGMARPPDQMQGGQERCCKRPEAGHIRRRLYYQMAQMAAEIRLRPDQLDAGALVLRDLAREIRFQRRQALNIQELRSGAAVARLRRDAAPIIARAAESLSPEQAARLEAILPDMLAP